MILKPRLFRKPRKGHWATKGLVGLWLFNEGSGNKVFDLVSGNTGTFVNETFWEPATTGLGLGADGTNDYVSFFNWNASGVSKIISGYPFTIVLAASHHTLNGKGNVVSITRNNQVGQWFECGFQTNNQAFAGSQAGASSQYAYSAKTFVVGERAVIAGVFESNSKRSVYANGIGPVTNAGSHGTTNFAILDCFNIFYENKSTNAYFEGRQFEFLYIYNRALSASEIGELYREPFCMFERDPIELWSAATLGAAPPVGMAGAMTTNTGYWGW